MQLLQEISALLDKAKIIQPIKPDKGWNIGSLGEHGLILSCDGFILRLDADELQKFFDIAEDGEENEIKDHNGDVVLVEPTENSIVLSRADDKVYPGGVILDLKTLKKIGIEENEKEVQEVQEGIKAAYRRSGKKIKRGFRVTSGFRKGRIVANARTAYKPRAKASTRMKLRIAGRRKRIIRILKSRKTRKKSLSKRLARMNKR